jgi:cystathionine beta-lyase
MSPVYMCFWSSIRETKRNVAVSPLVNDNGTYLIDFASLEECLKKSKILLLCSPHNPSGRVWTAVELKRINSLAKKYHVLVLSDEIHSDLVMPGFNHIPFISLDQETASYTITLLSATKTFNIAQSGMSFITTANQEYLKRIREAMTSFHLGSQNVFATVMVDAAYRYGATWLDQVIPYVYENYQLIKQTLETKMPKIKILPLEGTYLAWLDCREMQKTVVDLFEKEAHILGEDGVLFGAEGAGYYRINIATPRKTIEKMLHRLEKAYQKCTFTN